MGRPPHKPYEGVDAPTTGGALIAMSGGVDSSVAALLTVEAGLDCIGATMKLLRNDDSAGGRENTCCTLEDAEDARAVAYQLGIPFYVFDFTKTFEDKVIQKFVEEYQQGETPNPCIDCNRYLKFDRLLRRGQELGKDHIVTGHYARIDRDGGSGRYLLRKGIDPTKDQSYVLYALTQEELAHTLFPLGGLTKAQVREIAAQQGFGNAEKQDSQDICFVRSGGYADFIQEYTGHAPSPGRFVDKDGNVLGEHKGIIHYTVGQRKGLGLAAAAPLYVCAVRAESNDVVVGTADGLYAKALIAHDINLIPVPRLEGATKAYARVRYKQQEQPATVWQLDADTLRVEFDGPQMAIAKGQAVVLYDGDLVLGGGTIDEVVPV